MTALMLLLANASDHWLSSMMPEPPTLGHGVNAKTSSLVGSTHIWFITAKENKYLFLIFAFILYMTFFSNMIYIVYIRDVSTVM